MNYTQARNYIDDCYKRGSVYGLDAITALTDALGKPQSSQKIIHIAGTNGKGSVGSFISSVLIKAGYKVGRFVSPYVFCYEEQFRINEKNIPPESFAEVMTLVKEASDKIPFEPTGFELETALALCYFNMEQCDVSIIECGLGGKSDATNVIDNNLLTVLTSISLDHTALLGDTITEITNEKCGIIKSGTEVVSAWQLGEAEKVIDLSCQRLGVKCHYVKKADIKNKKYSGCTQSFDYGKFTDIEISMLGCYQLENAALALECIEVLNTKGFEIDKNAVYDGMRSTGWKGRFEIVNSDPVFILDGAHNPDAAKRLKDSLDLYFKGRKMVFIIGVFADKDYDGILKITAPMADKIFAIKAPTKRGLDNSLLSEAIEKYNKNVVKSELKNAVEYCLDCKDYITVAFGSLSFMGEIMQYIQEYKEQ